MAPGGEASATDPVVSELALLHRSRGLRRSELGPSVGPGLREVLDLPPDIDETELRLRLVDALIAASAPLASDLRAAFLHALAVKSAHRLLQERLKQAGAEIDRDARTVRRRLEAANIAVARRLRSSHERRANHPQAPTGWTVTAMSSVLDLRLLRPSFTAEKTILAAQRVTSLTESFFIPRVSDEATGEVVAAEPDIEVEVGAGGRLEGLTRVAPRNWRYQVVLDQPLRSGDLLTYSVKVTVPEHRYFAPYNAVAPLRPCASFDCRVYFDPDRLPALIQQIDGLPSSIFNDLIGDTDLLPVAAEVDVRFTALVPGLAYGLRWAF